jgi:hypothetical protein
MKNFEKKLLKIPIFIQCFVNIPTFSPLIQLQKKFCREQSTVIKKDSLSEEEVIYLENVAKKSKQEVANWI